MRIQYLLHLVCLLTSCSLAASNMGSPTFAASTTFKPAESDCEIPPPDNFHVEATGTTWVELAWDFQVDAIGGYRIRTYRVSDNALINTTIKPRDQTNAHIDLPDPVDYVCVINSICENGTNSGQTFQIPVTGLVLELVVSGYQGNANNSECSISAGGDQCFFPASSTPTAFRISNGLLSQTFGMVGSANELQCLLPNNSTQGIFFTCSNGGAPANGQSCVIFTIIIKCYMNGNIQDIANLSLIHTYTTNTLRCNSIGSGFSILGGNNEASYDRSVGEQGEKMNTEETRFAANPNPFSEKLDVVLSHIPDGPLTLQLFNLSGQKVLDHQFEGSQMQYSLNTAILSTGFYLLRIEANGEVQTFKVIKSE